MTRQANEHDWLLKDEHGNKVKNSQGYYIFDLSKEEIRQWWQETCLNATKASSGDGCFCDSSSEDKAGKSFKPPISDQKMKQWMHGWLAQFNKRRTKSIGRR